VVARKRSFVEFSTTEYHLVPWLPNIEKARKPSSPLQLRRALARRGGRGPMMSPKTRPTGRGTPYSSGDTIRNCELGGHHTQSSSDWRKPYAIELCRRTKISASSCRRCPIHSLRSCGPFASRNARRTKRVIQ
jgi:hypothetical protein